MLLPSFDDMFKPRFVPINLKSNSMRHWWNCAERGTTTQRHNDTPTQGHNDTPTQRHNDTPTQRHTDTTTQRHNDTTTQRHNDTTTQGHKDTTTQRHNDTPTQRHTDTLRTGTCPVALYPSEISHGHIRDRTVAFAVRCRRLTD